MSKDVSHIVAVAVVITVGMNTIPHSIIIRGTCRRHCRHFWRHFWRLLPLLPYNTRDIRRLFHSIVITSLLLQTPFLSQLLFGYHASGRSKHVRHIFVVVVLFAFTTFEQTKFLFASFTTLFTFLYAIRSGTSSEFSMSTTFLDILIRGKG